MKNVLTIIDMAHKAGRSANHIKIENKGWMPLVIECLSWQKGPNGYPVVSVAHYGEMNGDLMRDPEMCFELVERDGERELFPFSFRNDYMGFDREVYPDRGDGKQYVNLEEKAGERSFARTWNKNIADQGFVSAYREELARAKQV